MKVRIITLLLLLPSMVYASSLDDNVTAPAESAEFDFVSRFFAPGVGVDEDPVTGSAHCCLVPYWSEKLGKTTMTAFQASARGGRVHIRLQGDRVFLGGQAVTVMKGELFLP